MHWLDPDYLPQTTGTLKQFVLNPHADIDGLLLTDGTEIHTPPHLSASLLRVLAPGAKLSVRGVKPRDSDVIVALAIDPAKGKRIVDDGPGAKHEKKPSSGKKSGKAVNHSGQIECLLHGPKGNVHGVLLMDGMFVRFAPHTAESLSDLLVVKGMVSVRGHSHANEHGTVIEADAIGSDMEALRDIASHEKPKHPKPHPKKPKKAP